jgi:hypothetical protein
VKRWHEIDEWDRDRVLDVLEDHVMDLETSAGVLRTRDRSSEIDKACDIAGATLYEEEAEAFRVAIAVLRAVAKKGERLSTGDAVQLYGELRIRK